MELILDGWWMLGYWGCAVVGALIGAALGIKFWESRT